MCTYTFAQVRASVYSMNVETREITSGSQYNPSTMWIPRIKSSSSVLVTSPESHFTSPKQQELLLFLWVNPLLYLPLLPWIHMDGVSSSWYVFRETLKRLFIFSNPTLTSTISAEIHTGWESTVVVTILALEDNPSLSLYLVNALVRGKNENT